MSRLHGRREVSLPRARRRAGLRGSTIGAALVAGLLACSGGEGPASTSGASGGLGAALAVHTSTPGLRVRLSVVSVPGNAALGQRTIQLDTPGSDVVEIEVDLSSCLGQSGEASCRVQLNAELLDPTGRVLDQTSSAPLTLADGERRTVPQPLVLREVNRIVVTPSPVQLDVGRTQTLVVTPQNVFGVMVVRTAVTFTTTAPTIVAVSSAGVVTCVSPGVVTVRVTVGDRTADVPVTCSVPPRVVVTPAAVTRSAGQGETISRVDTLRVTNGGGGSLTGVQAAVSAGAPWLSATVTTTTAPATVFVNSNPTGLNPGTFAATVTVSSSTRPDVTAVVIPVTFTIAPQSPRIVLNPPQASFSAVAGSVLPNQLSVVVTNGGTGTLSGLSIGTVVDLATGGDPTWLDRSFSGPTAPTTLFLRPNTTQPVGTRSARVEVRSTAPGVTNSPQFLDVTYVISSGTPGVSVSGRVFNASNNTGIAGAVVTATRLGSTVNSTTTDLQGAYAFDLPVANGYTFGVAASGFVTTSIVSLDVSAALTAPPVPLALASATAGAIAGTARSATTGAAIGAGVTVELRQNVNNRTGATVATATTNASGNYTFASVPVGTYTLLGRVAGYSDGQATAASIGAQTTTQDLLMSPTLTGGAVRIVLRWGATPTDLDSHITFPTVSGARGWVQFDSPGVCTVDPVCLDIDDTDGFGPETITIQNVIPGVYRYYVNNFSGQFEGDPATLAQSNAIVEVFQGAGTVPVRTFTAPQLAGTMWFVFELNGTTITTINRMVAYNGTQPARILSPFSPETTAEIDLNFMRNTLRRVLKKPRSIRR
ncbi:MAG: carboxypeptidase regulatory-like domain-containing protein [Gemmatimonadaceae bacterium]